MTQGQITRKVQSDSGKAFQSVTSLQRRYGIEAASVALSELTLAIQAGTLKRVRVYGREAGGIGPV